MMGWNASEARTMKRRRRTSYCGAHYPDAASFKRRHGRAGLGLVVGAALKLALAFSMLALYGLMRYSPFG